MGLGEVFKLFATLGIDATEFDAGLAGAEQKLSSVEQSFTGAGRSLTMGVTAPIVGMGTAALHSSITFESAFAGVRKTVDATEQEFAELETGIRDMATRLPSSAEEIARVAEAAGQLGIHTENILGFTEVMIGLGEATNMSSDEAATALARFANIVQMPQDKFEQLGSTIVDLGNNLATTEGEIVEMGLRLAGAGNTIGLSEAEIMGFAGALSSVGIRAEAGGTAFSRVMLNMMAATQQGGDELEGFATTAGMSTDEFVHAFQTDPVTAIEAFVSGLQRIQGEGGNVLGALDQVKLGEIRVRDALLRLAGAGDVMSDSVNLATDAWSENAALQEEVGRRYETTESQLQMAKNSMQEVVRTLGDALVPLLLQVIEAAKPLIAGLQSIAEWFGNLNPAVQTFLVGAAGLLAALGPVLWMVGSFAGAIKNLLPLLRFVPGAFTGIRTALGLLTGPVGWIITAIGLIVAAWATDFLGLRTTVTENWGKVVDFFGGVWDKLKTFIGNVGEAFSKGWNAVKDTFQAAKDNVKNNLDAIKHNMGVAGRAVGAVFRGDWRTALAAGTELLDNWWSGLNDMLGGIPQKVYDLGSRIVTRLRDGMGSVWSTLQSNVTNNLDAMRHNFRIAGEGLKALFQGDWNRALKAAQEVFDNWWSAVNDFFGGIPQKMLEFGKDLIQGLIDGVKSMLTGAVDAVKGVGESVVNGFKNLLGIESPSKVFHEFGADIGEGLAQGIESKEARVLGAVADIARSATAGAAFGARSAGTFGSEGWVKAITDGLDDEAAVRAIQRRLNDLTDRMADLRGYDRRTRLVTEPILRLETEALEEEMRRLTTELSRTRAAQARDAEAQTRRFSLAVGTFDTGVRGLQLARQRY